MYHNVIAAVILGVGVIAVSIGLVVWLLQLCFFLLFVLSSGLLLGVSLGHINFFPLIEGGNFFSDVILSWWAKIGAILVCGGILIGVIGLIALGIGAIFGYGL